MSNARSGKSHNRSDDVHNINDHAVAMYLQNQTKDKREIAEIHNLILQALVKLQQSGFPGGELVCREFINNNNSTEYREYVIWTIASYEPDSSYRHWGFTSQGKFVRDHRIYELDKLAAYERKNVLRLLKRFIKELR